MSDANEAKQLTRQQRRKAERKEKRRKLQNEAWDKRLDKQRKTFPVRNDCHIVSVLDQMTGKMHFGVRRGAFGGSDEVGITLNPEDLAGAIENVAEMAKLINNLGIMVMAKLIDFDLARLAGEPELWPKQFAQWAHIDVEALLKEAAEEEPEAVRSSTAEVAFGDQTVRVPSPEEYEAERLQAELDAQPDQWRGPDPERAAQVIGLGDFIPGPTENDEPAGPERLDEDAQWETAERIMEQHSEALSRLAD